MIQCAVFVFWRTLEFRIPSLEFSVDGLFDNRYSEFETQLWRLRLAVQDVALSWRKSPVQIR